MNPDIRRKVDRITDVLWAGGVTNPVTYIEQLSYLIFLKLLEGWKRLVDIVPSTSNGITFDCGVTREMGHDPVEVCRYFGAKDRINHVHFRNVRVRIPREKYTEVFPDEGEVNMFAVMKELVRQKYPRVILPECLRCALRGPLWQLARRR